MIIDTIELDARKIWLDQLLIGYQALLNSPDTTEEQRNELLQGTLRHQAELANVHTVINSIVQLFEMAYPGRPPETANLAVTRAIKTLADNVVLAANVFKPVEISRATPLTTHIL